MSTSRTWSLTINNPSDHLITAITNGRIVTNRGERTYSECNIKFICGQLERGEEGTPHLQIYAIFERSQSLTRVTNLFPRCHAEISRAGHAANIEYCTKEDTREAGSVPFFHGIRPNYGRRNGVGEQLNEIKTSLDDGTAIYSVANMNFSLFCRYYRAFQEYQSLSSRIKSREVGQTYILYGLPGTGKTRWVRESPIFTSIYSQTAGRWFDGYDPINHDTVLFDEYNARLPASIFLNIVDVYSATVTVEVKGRTLPFLSKYVVVISNTHPLLWYKSRQTRLAINRRIREPWCTLRFYSGSLNEYIENDYTGFDGILEGSIWHED